MSEYIKREDAIEWIKSIREENSTIEEAEGLIIAEDAIANLPPADVVEVVRCKDCRWWNKQSDSLQGRCELTHSYPTGAWYCANGARKEEQEHECK